MDSINDFSCDFEDLLELQKKHCCRLCSKSFERLHVYRKHMNSHGEVVPFKFKRKAESWLDKTSDIFDECEKKGLNEADMKQHFFMTIGDDADVALTEVKQYLRNNKKKVDDIQKNIDEFCKKRPDCEAYFSVIKDDAEYQNEKKLDEELEFISFATVTMKALKEEKNYITKKYSAKMDKVKAILSAVSDKINN